jgi:hypothetical protein
LVHRTRYFIEHLKRVLLFLFPDNAYDSNGSHHHLLLQLLDLDAGAAAVDDAKPRRQQKTAPEAGDRRTGPADDDTGGRVQRLGRQRSGLWWRGLRRRAQRW